MNIAVHICFWIMVGKESACNVEDPSSIPGLGRSFGEGKAPTPVFLGFSGGSAGKESACNAGDLGSIPGLGRSPRGGHGNFLQYSCLENPHGQRSLTNYSLWGHKESDTTEWLSTAQPCVFLRFTKSVSAFPESSLALPKRRDAAPWSIPSKAATQEELSTGWE